MNDLARIDFIKDSIKEFYPKVRVKSMHFIGLDEYVIIYDGKIEEDDLIYFERMFPLIKIVSEDDYNVTNWQ